MADDLAAPRRSLAQFSSLLDAHIRDFREHGEFPESHQRLINEIQNRRQQVARKLERVEREGTTWELLTVEIDRDIQGLFDQLSLLNERIDAEQMKSRG